MQKSSNTVSISVICEKMSTREPRACNFGKSLSRTVNLPEASISFSSVTNGGPGSAPSKSHGWLQHSVVFFIYIEKMNLKTLILFFLNNHKELTSQLHCNVEQSKLGRLASRSVDSVQIFQQQFAILKSNKLKFHFCFFFFWKQLLQ